MNQLLIALRFLATGNFYITIGDFGGIHKSTAGNIVDRVITAICNLRPQYIRFPETEEEKQQTKTNFYAVARFPRVLGAIDCTYVRLQSPGGQNAEIFRNRKGYFSLNIQAVCDANHKFLDLVSHWPGSAHDSHIFNNSALKMRFQNNEMGSGILIGDSGYAIKTYLLTPIDHPEGEGENLYNESHIRTRNVIERTFGMWKRRFPILSIGIRTKLELAQKIVIACGILHNLACEQNEEIFEGDEQEDNVNDLHIMEANVNDNNGYQARAVIIDYFTNLLNQ